MRQVLAIVLLTCAAARAHAGGPDRIAVVAGTGDPSATDAAVLAPVLDELGKRGYEQGTALSADIDARISRADGVLSASQVVEGQKDVDDAYQRFIDGEYPRAQSSARAALTIYDAASGQLAREPALRDLRYKALIVAARSSEINGAGEDAFALMAEAIRSFPDRAINPAQFDPSVNALYRRVKEELAKQGAGSLEVKADDPAATIFVDEQFVASGDAKLDHTPPGHYRIYVSKGANAGRVREVDVAPGAAVSVSVPWSIDGALRTTKTSVALSLDADAGTDAEVQSAVRLGHVLGAHTVVVVSVRSINGRRAIAGYSINVESQTRAFAAVQVEPVAPSPATISKLAALLAGDKGVGGAELITVEPVDRPPAGGGHPLGGKRVVALGLGAIAVGSLVGAVAFELSSRSTYDQSKVEVDDAKQNALYDSANKKYKYAQGFAVGGLVCAAAATYLWFTGVPRDESDRGVAFVPAPTPDGVGFVVSGRF